MDGCSRWGGRGTYTIDRIWKKSYFAKSLCGWCSCSYCDGSSAFLDPISRETRRIAREYRASTKARRNLTVQKLLTSRLKMLKMTTNITALHFALKPTTTITQATNPNKLTTTLAIPQSPAKTKPTNRKINRTLPASWMYILRSFSSMDGSPAGANLLRTQESLRTMRRPPITLRLRRKKFKSNMRP